MFAVFLVRAQSENTLIYSGFVPLAWKKYFLQHAENRVNTTVFCQALAKKHIVDRYREIAISKKDRINVLGFRKTSVFTVFLPREFPKKRENTTHLTILGYCETEKKAAGVATTTRRTRTSTKFATKRCVVRWLQAAVWKEHHTVLCTCARAEHMNNTNAHTAIHNLWHRRCATFAGQQGSGPYTHCAKRWTASRGRSAPSKLREEIKGDFSAAMVTAMEAMEEQASKVAPAPATPAGGAKQ